MDDHFVPAYAAGVIHTGSELKYILYTISILLALTILAGVSTFFFKETFGEVIDASRSEVQGAAYPAHKGGAQGYDGGKKTVVNIRYRYKAGEQTLTSSLFAFWIIDTPKETYWSGQKVSVFYIPSYPKIAVLKRGPDKWLLLSAIAMFIGWFLLRSALRGIIEDV